MESSNQDDNYSLNSSIDQEQEQTSYNMGGVGRSYECVFCKQGFNTAQALGGHMNIHRKHKATKNKPSTNITHNLLSSSSINNYKHEIHNNLSSGANLRCYNVAEVQSTHFPSSASTSTNGQIFLNHNRISNSHDDHHNIQCLNLFGENWGLQFGTHNVIETIEKKSQEDEHLDLELRLGHDPLKQ